MMSGKNADEIREVGIIVRDQMNLLRSIKDEEEDLESSLDEVEQIFEQIESLKKTSARRMILDPNALMKCYKCVIFASEFAKTKLLIFGRILMNQRLVKKPDPYVTMNMQYDFMSAFHICLQQSIKVLKQMRLSINISVLDSIMNIAQIVQKYVGPANMYRERDLERKAKLFRNKKILDTGEEVEHEPYFES